MSRRIVATGGRGAGSWTAGIALASLVLAGCPSMTTMGPARTLRAGQSQTWVSAGAYRTTLVTGEPPGPVEREEVWLPLLEAGWRVGLGERADLGLRAGTGGAGVVTRVQLVRSPDPDRGGDVMIAASAGWVALMNAEEVSGGFVGLGLPAGLNLGGGSQLVVAPRLAIVSDRVLGATTLVGGSAGFAIHLAGPVDDGWYLVPECAVMDVSSGGDAYDGPLVQCALGIVGRGGRF